MDVQPDLVTELYEVTDDDYVKVICLDCGYEFETNEGDWCENCGGSDLELV